MIRFFHDKVQLMFFLISVGFHVGFGCKPKPHMQSLAASDGSRSTDNGVLFCWLPCWFPAFGEVTMGKVPWGSMLGAMLASMLGSSCQGMGEATIGKIPVGFHVGVMLVSSGLDVPGGPSPVGSKSSGRCVSRWVNVET